MSTGNSKAAVILAGCAVLGPATAVFRIIALVEDPTEVESFMERFKCETAHAVNRLLGRRQVTVWNEGYDSPIILTLEDLIEKIAYVYANPVRAHRTDSIDNYLGGSSWQMFTSGALSKEVARIRRPFIQPLSKGVLSPSEIKRYAAHVTELAQETLTFTLTPDAWTVAFPNQMTIEQFNGKVLKRIREIEQEMAAVREKERIILPTEYQIITQPIDTPYSPTTFGLGRALNGVRPVTAEPCLNGDHQRFFAWFKQELIILVMPSES